LFYMIEIAVMRCMKMSKNIDSSKDETERLVVDIPKWLKDLVDDVKDKTGIPINMQVRKALIKFFSPYKQYIGKGSYKEIEDEIFRT